MMSIRITIHSLSTRSDIMLEQDPCDTIADLKLKIYKQKKIKVCDQILCFDDEQLDDRQTIEYYGIKDKSRVDMKIQRRTVSNINKKDAYYFKNFKKSMSELLPRGYNSIDELQKMYKRQKWDRSKMIPPMWRSQVHIGAISNVIVSPNNQYIIMVLKEGSVKVLHYESKEEFYCFNKVHEKCENSVMSIVVSKDSKSVISACKNSIKILSLEMKQEIFCFEEIHKNDISSLVLFSEDKYLASGSHDKCIKILDLEKKEEVYTFENAHDGLITSLAVSSNDEYLISGSEDNSIKIFDIETKAQIHYFKEIHDYTITSIVISPDNKHIFSVSLDDTIKMIDLETKKEVHTFRRTHLGGVNSLVLSHNGKYFISLGSEDSLIKIFEIDSKLELHSFEGINASTIAISPNNKHIIYGESTGHCTMLELERKLDLDQLGRSNLCLINCLAVSPDSNFVVGGYWENPMKLFSFQTKKEICELQENNVMSVCFSFDSQYIISGGNKGSIKIFECKTAKEVHNFHHAHEDTIFSVTTSAEDKYIVSASVDKSIKIFNFQTKEEVYHIKNAHKTLKSKKDSIYCVVISPDDKYIITGSYDKSMKIFDFQTRKQVYHFKDVHEYAVLQLAVLPNNKYLVSLCCNSLKIFDIKNKIELCIIKKPEGEQLVSMAITPNNKYIITGTQKGSIQIIDIEAKVQVHFIKNFVENDINGMAISPDGDYLIFSVEENSIKILALDFLGTSKLSFGNILLFDTINLTVSSSIPCLTNFNAYDDLLLKYTSNQSLMKSYEDLCILPHQWNLLHLLAIFKPQDFHKVLTYPDLKVSSLVDKYKRTPLHYLIAHDKIHYTSTNIIMKYIIDYLEDKERSIYEYQMVCESLSNILPIIITKMSSKFVEQYMKLCFIPTPTQYGDSLPAFGEPEKKLKLFNSPILLPDTKKEIFQEGNEQIAFRTVMLHLNYNPNSDDMFNIISHLLFIKSEAIFKSPAIMHIINYLWDQTFLWRTFIAILYTIMIILVSVQIGLPHNTDPIPTIISALLSFFVLHVIVQAFTLRLEYFKDPWNWLDLTHFPLIFVLFFTEADYSANLSISSWIILSGYLRWASYLRLFNRTRNLIQMLVSIFFEMFGFVVLLGLIILGCSLILLEFDNSQIDKEDNNEPNYIEVLYETYKLIYADIKEGELNLSQKILSAWIVFFIHIVLLDLLISIIGDSYAKTQEKKVLNDSLTRLTLIQETIALKRIWRRNLVTNKSYMMICGPINGDEDDQNPFANDLDGKMNVIKKFIKQTETKLSQEIIQAKKDITMEGSKDIKYEMDQMSQEVKQIKDEFTHIKEQILQNREEICSLRSDIISEVNEKFQHEISKFKTETKRLNENLKKQVEANHEEMKEMIQELMRKSR